MFWKRLRPNRQAGAMDLVRQLQRQNDNLFLELSQVQQRFGGLARSVWDVQEDERRRIARELHDGVGQTLTALCHRIESLPVDPEHQESALGLCRQALEDVRELSRLLRPPVLDDLGLGSALNWLGRRIRESRGIPVSVHVGSGIGRLAPGTETLIFRVAQEALANAARHAEPSRVGIQLSRVGNRLDLRVRDNGRGFDPEAVKQREDRGVGLAGMRDRVVLFGGDLLVSSRPGQGTTVSASLVLPDGEAHESDTSVAGG